MEIQLKTTFKNPDGKFLTSNNKEFLHGEDLAKAEAAAAEKKQPFENGKILYLRDVLIICVSTEFPEDQKDLANIMNEKLKRYAIYQLLIDTTEASETIDLKPEDVTYLKPRVARAFGMLVAGPALKALDGK